MAKPEWFNDPIRRSRARRLIASYGQFSEDEVTDEMIDIMFWDWQCLSDVVEDEERNGEA